MNVYSLIAGITTYVALFAGTYVFSKNTKNQVNRLFFYFSLLVVLYAFSEYNYLITDNLKLAKLWFRISMTWPFIFAIQLHLLLAFANRLRKVRRIWFYFMYGIPLVITYLLMFVIGLDVHLENQHFIRISFDQKSVIDLIQFLFAILSTIFIFIVGIDFLIKAKDKKRAQTVLLLIGIALPSIHGALRENFSSVQFLNIVPTSTVAFLGWIFFLIAILQYQMFNITPEYAAERIISTMKESLLLINEEGIVVTVNNEFTSLFNLDGDDIMGQPFDFFLKMCEFPDQPIDKIYQQQELKNKQFNYKTRDGGKLCLTFTNSFIRDSRNNIIGHICIITDINELMIAQEQLTIQHKKMLDLAHQAGMAEIATDVVHNIGNVLNSVNISSEKITEILTNTKLQGFIEATRLLKEQQDNLPDFFTNDPKSKVLIQYYIELSEILKKENEQMKEESSIMHEKIEIIKAAIDIQQNYARLQDLDEPIVLSSLLDESVKIMDPMCKKSRIMIQKNIMVDENYTVMAPKIKLLNTILNLLKNSIEAINLKHSNDGGIIKIQLEKKGNIIELGIVDNGIGISKEELKHIFTYGFSTKAGGHGFGLHFCANSLKEMGWDINARSNGPGLGAEFKIIIPE